MIHNPGLPLPATILPHQGESLWLDGVTEVDAYVSGHGFWTPPEADFAGHYPDMPILMGARQLESLAQLTTYVLLINTTIDSPVTLVKHASADFKAAIQPGQILDLAVTIIEWKRNKFTSQGTIFAGKKQACEATIEGIILPKSIAHLTLGIKPPGQ